MNYMKLGFFFGAGAEIGYGLPSGGKFAIDLFRQNTSPYREEFRKQLKAIDIGSPYAADWLPQGFKSKSIYAFGRNEFTSLMESSIEYQKDEIIRRLNRFDIEFEKAMVELELQRVLVESKFEELTGRQIGDRLYTHEIKLNELLARDVTLFGSSYYSAMLDAIRTNNACDDLKRYVIAFLQLLVGAHGQDLIRRLNQELFENAPDDLPIFDDITGMFRIEFSRIGSTALELLLEEKRFFETDPENCTGSSLLNAIAQKILENIFTTVLDYQKLIDDHFRYLFSPKTEWAKFTKMSIFLKVARQYISEQIPSTLSSSTGGYYHDLAQHAEQFQINAVGTANYNSLITPVFKDLKIEAPDVIHLNGSVDDYYNPYKNTIVTEKNFEITECSQIHLPFILTQSGIKPLTSVAMSRRYVELFDAYRDSKAVIIVGFGFNNDDSHINGLFRELIEEHQKKIFVVSTNKESDVAQQQRNLRKRLRIENSFTQQLNVIPVEQQTRKINGELWIESILKTISKD